MREDMDRIPESFIGKPLLAEDLLIDQPVDVRSAFSNSCREIGVQAGFTLIESGTRATRIFILETGSGTVRLSPAKGVSFSRHILRNEIVGLPEALTGAEMSVSAVTDTDSRFRVVEGLDLISLLRSHSTLCYRLVDLLGSNLHSGKRLFNSFLP
ncbi:MAG: cyclic nucleotide-binding domain-containing protein [Acidobacteria bacterium]|nr:MAG: cyclic nucleotide-binding domain-containing protein [Acidobacteriota bacterium]REJ99035.1 MAG: cyclic nucleotide-binding domain-containing protein [Acidobacteriota bacterium]REK16244.1 MAG: cyclic nucleotide-binding domain-containing protein [Acidobacteriota bacterium]REK43925.1 MAG: cyclic nucleotide-binding domain-containing protein [Acidobacteriota bacterium]